MIEDGFGLLIDILICLPFASSLLLFSLPVSDFVKFYLPVVFLFGYFATDFVLLLYCCALLLTCCDACN